MKFIKSYFNTVSFFSCIMKITLKHSTFYNLNPFTRFQYILFINGVSILKIYTIE